MNLTKQQAEMGFSLKDADAADISAFIYVEKVSHSKYVLEHADYFGAFNEQILIDSFHGREKMTFFKKLLFHGQIAGFLSYDQKEDQIENVLIKIIPEAQNKGIGTWFLSELKKLSEKFSIPVLLVAIKTNPAQHLYRKLGFNVYKEEDVFLFFNMTVCSSGRKDKASAA